MGKRRHKKKKNEIDPIRQLLIKKRATNPAELPKVEKEPAIEYTKEDIQILKRIEEAQSLQQRSKEMSSADRQGSIEKPHISHSQTYKQQKYHGLSNKQLKELRLSALPKLKLLAPRHEVVEIHDVSAADPTFLVKMKSIRNSVPVPGHWLQKRRYLQNTRGIQRIPFQIPPYIESTGISKVRGKTDVNVRQSLKEQAREHVNPHTDPPRHEVVEIHDVSAADPTFLVKMKSIRNSVPVPGHWLQKRRYLQNTRGIQRIPFQIPPYIESTGISKVRGKTDVNVRQSLKEQAREHVNPHTDRLYVDYSLLKEAFTHHMSLPHLSRHGDMFYLGKKDADNYLIDEARAMGQSSSSSSSFTASSDTASSFKEGYDDDQGDHRRDDTLAITQVARWRKSPDLFAPGRLSNRLREALGMRRKDKQQPAALKMLSYDKDRGMNKGTSHTDPSVASGSSSSPSAASSRKHHEVSHSVSINSLRPSLPPQPPPFLFNMQRYGPPPSYSYLLVPGVNCAIPKGCAYGFYDGGWGEHPKDPTTGEKKVMEKERKEIVEKETEYYQGVEGKRWGESEDLGDDELSEF
ncbi:hypothetical protein ADUPG1_009003 [Aduncisulcus paluster]|uniref:PSP proline-rich domain-containing protein n=1 Tax=Aduncisulcus paluster TaxID=2918883 RepID=A0ABQ5KU06_9EUKA|nr:hypothetical protein ADUPG1_009003 [Aduncisulcus paluster]